MNTHASTSQRPTLPSLHTLNLPTDSKRRVPTHIRARNYSSGSSSSGSSSSTDGRTPSPTPSSCTSASPSPCPPSPKLRTLTQNTTPTPTPATTTKPQGKQMRLVPSALENAHAILLLPSPSYLNYSAASPLPSPSPYQTAFDPAYPFLLPATDPSQPQMPSPSTAAFSLPSMQSLMGLDGEGALLLVGPAMAELKNGGGGRVGRMLSRGARVHPYRIVARA
ncbi:hypothetical protein FIBSPDRAFT_846973 [Athelia psychrophila]|uniref:Uncharacterized protein n=1 Tax=Athelia psychrophila TaxID=1759441 RepID=A0A166WJ31_9AGAM|nr:hypothetical protein FIBSPDRAFT_846973 [Fibularhizoctonia sp. CBS 109695]